MIPKSMEMTRIRLQMRFWSPMIRTVNWPQKMKTWTVQVRYNLSFSTGVLHF